MNTVNPFKRPVSGLDMCNAVRSFHPSHDELMVFLACFASSITDGQSALNDKCRRVVVDLLDEINGQVEQDQIDQQVEQTWLGVAV